MPAPRRPLRKAPQPPPPEVFGFGDEAFDGFGQFAALGEEGQGLEAPATWCESLSPLQEREVVLVCAGELLLLRGADGVELRRWDVETLRAYGQEGRRFVIEAGRGAAHPGVHRFRLHDGSLPVERALRAYS